MLINLMIDVLFTIYLVTWLDNVETKKIRTLILLSVNVLNAISMVIKQKTTE